MMMMEKKRKQMEWFRLVFEMKLSTKRKKTKIAKFWPRFEEGREEEDDREMYKGWVGKQVLTGPLNLH